MFAYMLHAGVLEEPRNLEEPASLRQTRVDAIAGPRSPAVSTEAARPFARSATIMAAVVTAYKRAQFYVEQPSDYITSSFLVNIGAASL